MRRTRTLLIPVACCLILILPLAAHSSKSAAQELDVVSGIAKQPLVAATKRLVSAMESAGSPFGSKTIAELEKAYRAEPDECCAAIQKVLDPLCIAGVDINAESRVKCREGACKKELLEKGWRAFLVKVHNQSTLR